MYSKVRKIDVLRRLIRIYAKIYCRGMHSRYTIQNQPTKVRVRKMDSLCNWIAIYFAQREAWPAIKNIRVGVIMDRVINLVSKTTIVANEL